MNKITKTMLGVYFASMVILALVMGLGGGTNKQYEVFRTVTATEDTQLTVATQQTAPAHTDDGTVAVRPQGGEIHIILMGTAAADKTLAWTLWAYKSASDPAEYVAHGTATTGLTQTGNTNEFYCDTIVITAQAWLNTLSVVDGAPDAIINGGGISKLIFDGGEYQYFNIIIRDIAGGGAEAATAGAKIANYY